MLLLLPLLSAAIASASKLYSELENGQCYMMASVSYMVHLEAYRDSNRSPNTSFLAGKEPEEGV